MRTPNQGRQPSTGQYFTRTRDALGVLSDLGGAVVSVSMLVAAAVGGAGIVVGLVNDQPAIAVFGGGLFLGVVIGVIVVQIIVIRGSSTLESQRGYRWRTAVYTYRIEKDDHHRHLQKVDVNIVAVRDGVRSFSNQYLWSGAGEDSGPQILSSGHSIFGPSREALGWRTYVVNLDPPLRKGHETTVSILQELNDHAERYQPFLAKTVHEHLERLVLRVELPPALTPDRYSRITRDGYGPEAREIARDDVEIPGNGAGAGTIIEWTIESPGYGRNYELAWMYEGGRSVYSAALRKADDNVAPA